MTLSFFLFCFYRHNVNISRKTNRFLSLLFVLFCRLVFSRIFVISTGWSRLVFRSLHSMQLRPGWSALRCTTMSSVSTATHQTTTTTTQIFIIIKQQRSIHQRIDDATKWRQCLSTWTTSNQRTWTMLSQMRWRWCRLHRVRWSSLSDIWWACLQFPRGV